VVLANRNGGEGVVTITTYPSPPFLSMSITDPLQGIVKVVTDQLPTFAVNHFK
jgi:hypothetical protein